MKIILILLISFTFGQDAVTDSSYITATHRILNPIYDTDVFDYAEECYNDSIDHIWTSWQLEYETDTSLCLTGVVVYDTTYYHYPPTFEGFVNYLRKNK